MTVVTNVLGEGLLPSKEENSSRRCMGAPRPDGRVPPKPRCREAKLHGAELDGAELDGTELDGAELDPAG